MTNERVLRTARRHKAVSNVEPVHEPAATPPAHRIAGHSLDTELALGTMQAVDGNTLSGVARANERIRPISSALTTRGLASHARAASLAPWILGVVSPSAAIWRRSIPVRSRIHSSDVSIVFSRSLLLTTILRQDSCQLPRCARMSSADPSSGTPRSHAASGSQTGH